MEATEKPTFDDVVREHGPFIRRTLSQLGVSARDLHDVEQEVRRGIDKRLPAFDPALASNPESAMRGWLFGISERQAPSTSHPARKRGCSKPSARTCCTRSWPRSSPGAAP
jgi:DNA-directed RNA polymerase specialized sigma24 family protein